MGRRRVLHLSWIAVACASAAVLSARPAEALQPLGAFLESSRAHNLDVREDAATLTEREKDEITALRGLLPVITATGQYTFNQYEAKVSLPVNGASRTAVITPQNQWDGYVTATIPLVNLSSWANIESASVSKKAAEAKLRATTVDVAEQVARSFYDVLINRALLASASGVLAADQANLDLVLVKESAGTAQALDVERARASVATSQQSAANAAYNVAVAERKLRTLSGLPQEPGGTIQDDDLHDEPSLEAFLGTKTAKQISSELSEEAQRKTEDHTRKRLLPTLSASAQERFTNATGFANENASFQGLVTLSISLDASVLSQTAAQHAASEVKAVGSARTTQDKDDKVYFAWMLVKTQIATCQAARASAASTKLAYAIARTKYTAGTAQQIDLLQADRDAFSAEVTRVQTNGDLRYDRIALRLTAGLPAGNEETP